MGFFPPVFDVIAQKTMKLSTHSPTLSSLRELQCSHCGTIKGKKKKTHTTPAQTFHYNTIISHLNRDGAIIKTVRVEQNWVGKRGRFHSRWARTCRNLELNKKQGAWERFWRSTLWFHTHTQHRSEDFCFSETVQSGPALFTQDWSTHFGPTVQ